MNGDEAKPSQRPTRFPDYQSPNNCYYWFEEMMWMDHQSILREIGLDHHNMLIKAEKDRVKKCNRCMHCIEDGICERNYFGAHIQDAYNVWWFNAFESHFFGEEDK